MAWTRFGSMQLGSIATLMACLKELLMIEVLVLPKQNLGLGLLIHEDIMTRFTSLTYFQQKINWLPKASGVSLD